MKDIFSYWAEKLEGETGNALQDAVKEAGLEVLDQMVLNISGNDVVWSGQNFKINVQTGNLRRHSRIEYPYSGDPYSVFVFNNASYASTIESGISGEEKKDRLLASTKAKISKKGRRYITIPPQGDLTSFWTVTEDSHLSDQPPRPFVEATAEQMKDRVSEIVGKAIMELIRDG